MATAQNIQADKATLRSEALARRDAMPAEARVKAVETVTQRPFPVTVPNGAIVSGFSPIKTEFNPVPLMRKLADAGASLALPVVAGRGLPLTMRAWKFGDAMASGVWGIREPKPEAPEIFPDILLVPLAAFDRDGHRIGYGAGHYDRTIARLREMKKVVAIGICFAVQEIEHVPATAFDQRLDLVLTENEIVDFRGS
jgi:5-formyltetrahydrofolate cyclo-ligase